MNGVTYWKRTKVNAMGAVLEIGLIQERIGTYVQRLDLSCDPPKPKGWPDYFPQELNGGYELAHPQQVAEAFAAAIRNMMPSVLIKPVVEILARAQHSHTCAECGVGFTPLHTKAIYCTPGCKQKAFRSRSGGKP